MVAPINQNLQAPAVADIHDAFLLRREAPLQDCIFSCEEEGPCCIEVIWSSITNWWRGLLSWLGRETGESRPAQEVQIWAATEEMGTYSFNLQTEAGSCKEFLEEIFSRSGDPGRTENARKVFEALLLFAEDCPDRSVEIRIDFVTMRRSDLNLTIPKNSSILATKPEEYWALLRDQWEVEERVDSTCVLTLKKRFAVA